MSVICCITKMVLCNYVVIAYAFITTSAFSWELYRGAKHPCLALVLLSCFIAHPILLVLPMQPVGQLPSFPWFHLTLQYVGKQPFLIHRKKFVETIFNRFFLWETHIPVHVWGNNRSLTCILASLVLPPPSLSSQQLSKSWGWQAPLVTICSCPLLTAGSAGAGCSGPATSHGFWASPSLDIPQPFWATNSSTWPRTPS